MQGQLDEWIGDLPAEWNAIKTKLLFRILKRQVPHKAQTILSITQRGIRPKNVSENEGQMAGNYDGYQEVFVGDFAMNSMDLLTGWVDQSQYDGLTSPDYRVFAPIEPNRVHGPFYSYVFQSLYTSRVYYRYGQGVSNMGRWRLPAHTFLNFPLPYPPIEEQRVIAKFIESKTSEIDGLVGKLKRERDLLERYRRELIARTVTRGLNPDARMRDSGIEWIGEIPATWHQRSLVSMLRRVSVKNDPKRRVLSVERAKGVVDRESEGSPDNHNRLPDDLSGYLVVEAGQFVMNKMKAWRGSYGVSKLDGIVSPAYFTFELDCPNPDFFNWAIRSDAYVPFFGRDSYGIRVDQWDFKCAALRTIPFFVPPVEEQYAIVSFLAEKTASIDATVAGIDRQIELLGMYRKQIINDAVTGKIRVGKAA